MVPVDIAQIFLIPLKQIPFPKKDDKISSIFASNWKSRLPRKSSFLSMEGTLLAAI